MYRGYVETMSSAMNARLDSILAEFGFDYGHEFEFVICEVLASVLPDKFGVCRGFVTDRHGKSAGDDIIIYDKTRFPTLGLRPTNSYARKEFVPVEAVAAYIEAKHTVTLVGEEESTNESKSKKKSTSSTLGDACGQVSRVKKHIASREIVRPGQLNPFLNINDLSPPGTSLVRLPEHMPAQLNPPFGMVFARRVKLKGAPSPTKDLDEIGKALDGIKIDDDQGPDLIVLGPDIAIVPVNEPDGERLYRSAFFRPGKSGYEVLTVPGRSYGLAIASLMAVLDFVVLGRLPWHAIIKDAAEGRNSNQKG